MVECGPGYYSLAAEDGCSISPPGKYAATTNADPTDVPDGSFSHPGMTYPLLCPPGYRCEEITGTHVTMCPPGSFYTAADGCTICEAGTYCPLAIGGYRTVGIDCPAGTYSNEGRLECTVCDPGNSCALKATEPTVCTAGDGTYAD